MNVKELLKEQYINGIKDNPELYIGVELEFPIVYKGRKATDTEVSKKLLSHLATKYDFEIGKYDSDHNIVQIYDKVTEDQILFEVSYNTIEIAFGKARTIQELDQRFQVYLRDIQSFLEKYKHEIQGIGINPNWDLNDNSAVKLPRYQMLLDFLSLSQTKKSSLFHNFPTYGSFICGNQVQLDVSQSNYLEVLNLFNKIEPIKAYLFGNSEFNGAEWDTKISRDIFWEQSMHGVFPENVGIFPKDFANEEEYLDYLTETAMFTVERDGETLFFEPLRLADYFQKSSVKGYRLNGETVNIKPLSSDIVFHRSYHYEDLTKRGTVEFRSVCTQSLNQTLTPPAFHLGLITNITGFKNFIARSNISSDDVVSLRRQFARLSLTQEQERLIKKMSQGILECSEMGLKMRNLGEETYLKPLWKKLE